MRLCPVGHNGGMDDTLWTAAEAAARLGRSRRTTVAVAERSADDADPGIRRVGHAWAAAPDWWAQALARVPTRAPRRHGDATAAARRRHTGHKPAQNRMS